MNENTWPLAYSGEDRRKMPTQRHEWVPTDPCETFELPPLVFPRPLKDKALLDDEETT